MSARGQHRKQVQVATSLPKPPKPRRTFLGGVDPMGKTIARNTGTVYHPICLNAWDYDERTAIPAYAVCAHALHVETFMARVEEEQRALREVA